MLAVKIYHFENNNELFINIMTVKPPSEWKCGNPAVKSGNLVQIRPQPDLARFGEEKNGRIPDLPEPKSGTALKQM
jgi:hypothetical protein